MPSFLEFFSNNATAIIILTLILFTLLVLFASFDDKFEDVAPYHDNIGSQQQNGKVVTVEAYENVVNGALPNMTLAQAFCQKHQSRPHELEARCNLLSPKACHIPSCCVLRNGIDCVAGNHHGPTFVDKKTNYFHHRGKCKNGRGVCPN